MSALIKLLCLVLLVSLPSGVLAQGSDLTPEAEKLYQKICALENNIPNVEDKHVDPEKKFLAVEAYWYHHQDEQFDLDAKFWALLPDRDSLDPATVKEKRRIIEELHRRDGASFTTIAGLSNPLTGSKAGKFMDDYVRSHPDLKMTQYAVWMLRIRKRNHARQ